MSIISNRNERVLTSIEREVDPERHIQGESMILISDQGYIALTSSGRARWNDAPLSSESGRLLYHTTSAEESSGTFLRALGLTK